MKQNTNTNIFENLQLNYKIWFETNDHKGILGDGKWKLLKLIDQTGSLKEAIEQSGFTYRKTWNNLRKIEKLLGFPVLETSRGGVEGGSTTLTDEGRKIIRMFDEFHAEIDSLMLNAFEKFREKMK
ncbi:MAG: ModE family transcriptional regulator [Bacteroidota bacterium]